MNYNVQLEVDTGGGVMAPISEMRVFPASDVFDVQQLNGWPAPEARAACISTVADKLVGALLCRALLDFADDCASNPGAVIAVIEVPE